MNYSLNPCGAFLLPIILSTLDINTVFNVSKIYGNTINKQFISTTTNDLTTFDITRMTKKHSRIERNKA